MTRREKILLQICVAIGLIGVSSIYMLRPSMIEKQRAWEALEAAQFQEVQISTVLDAQNVEETLEKQKDLAERNYEYFYGELNAYTIDGILNQLVTACGMDIESMTIGEYIQVDIETLSRESDEIPEANEEEISDEAMQEVPEDENQEQKEQFLLGCHVTLNVNGSYEQFLKFVDSLEEESTCIEIVALNLQMNERSTEYEQAVGATAELLVYGIDDTMLEGKEE